MKSENIHSSKVDKNKDIFPPLIEPGSVNKLASLVIPALTNHGLTISTLEDLASSGEIISALTIEGSGEIVNKSVIIPDMWNKFCRKRHSYKRAENIIALIDMPLSKNSGKTNNVMLATLGDFDDNDHTVHIGLKIGKKHKSISLTKKDYYKAVNTMNIAEEDMLSTQKQFIADQALRFLLRELNIVSSDIQFEPQIERDVLHKSKIDLLKYLSIFLKGQKISLVESAPGGYASKLLTHQGKNLLSSGIILYNTYEKLEAGILEEALEGDNLYGKATAFALALIAKKRNKENVAIGITGLLDTEDSRLSYRFREPGVVYYSIIIPGHEPVTEKIILPIRSRLEMKAGLTLIIFQRLLQILIQEEMKAVTVSGKQRK